MRNTLTSYMDARYTMTAFVFFVCRHPEVYARVVAEVRGKFASEADVTMVATGELPYLKACIEETMRMSPPTPSALPRWVPEGGEEIDGKWVPGGVSLFLSVTAKVPFY
jgi:cytochrome P450